MALSSQLLKLSSLPGCPSRTAVDPHIWARPFVAACSLNPSHRLQPRVLHSQQASSDRELRDRAESRAVTVRSSPVKAAEADTASGVDISELIELDLKVEGMTCSHCVSRVTEALQGQPIVQSASVSLEKGLATIFIRAENQFDAFEQMPKLVDVVTEAGFPAQPHFGDDI